MVEENKHETCIKLNDKLGSGVLSKYVFKVKAADGTLDYLFAKCLELEVKSFIDTSFPHCRDSLISDWSEDECA